MKCLVYQPGLAQDQAALARDLKEGRTSPEQYLEALNERLRQFTMAARELVSPRDFAKLFDSSDIQPDSLIDREIFLATARRD